MTAAAVMVSAAVERSHGVIDRRWPMSAPRMGAVLSLSLSIFELARSPSLSLGEGRRAE